VTTTSKVIIFFRLMNCATLVTGSYNDPVLTDTAYSDPISYAVHKIHNDWKFKWNIKIT